MGIMGQADVEKFRAGKKLTWKQSIKAQCFICNGETEGYGQDCQGHSCPLYPWFKKWFRFKKTPVSKQVA